jgi:hypothetical protein
MTIDDKIQGLDDGETRRVEVYTDGFFGPKVDYAIETTRNGNTVDEYKVTPTILGDYKEHTKSTTYSK